MTPLSEKVRRTICSQRLLPRSAHVLAAVSGGLDSMVLLHLLAGLATEHGWRLKVAHFNHGLRGRSSDADERLVRRTARKLGLPCICGRADVRHLGREQSISLEMAARESRHRFLAETAKQKGGKIIATAHHADDQVELFFVRLLRGAGVDGLAGMRASSPSPADHQIRLVRPLLNIARDELAAYAQEERIPFRTDASNASMEPLRNRVRHHLLPSLRRDYQPAVTPVTLRLMELLRTESDWIDAEARVWLKRGKSAFVKLHRAVQRRCVLLQLHELGVTPEFEVVDWLIREPGQWITTAGGITVRLSHDGRIVRQRVRKKGHLEGSLALSLTDRAGSCSWAGLEIAWEITSMRGFRKPARVAGREWFDADAVGRRVLLRHWQPGDRFQPIGMQSAVKLQDLFVNLRIPYEHRRELVLGEAADGNIFWVEGLRIGERFKLTRTTSRRLLWRWGGR